VRRTLTALALAAASAIACGAAPAAAQSRLAQARVESCDRAAREAVFVGRMTRVRGTARMSMRFSLQQREAGDDSFARLRAPGLGRWRRSRPGVRRFIHRQRVRGLSETSTYRAVVDFRWRDAGGRVVRRARRRSGLCRPAGDLPDLRVTRLYSRNSSTPGTAVYNVRIANRGRASAGAFAVSLAVDGSAVDSRTVPGLEPGTSRGLDFSGPLCSSGIRVVVDSGGAVAEANEDDNELSIRCASARARPEPAAHALAPWPVLPYDRSP
jgi:hypothetical protein